MDGNPSPRARDKIVRLCARMFILLIAFPVSCTFIPAEDALQPEPHAEVALPEPRYDSDFSLEKALLNRRSVREYSNLPLTLEQVSQLLWAAQGTTSPEGLRSAPSAGGTYPLEVYLVAGNVTGLAPGVYRYITSRHTLEPLAEGDIRGALSEAALAQDAVKQSPADIVLAAVYARTMAKYGERGMRYVHMEAGHAAQNVCLQAVSLGLGSVVIGAFYDDRIQATLGLSGNEQPLYIIPVGTARQP